MSIIPYLAIGPITFSLVVVGLIAIFIVAAFLIAIVLLSLSLITLERVTERVVKIGNRSTIAQDSGNSASPF